MSVELTNDEAVVLTATYGEGAEKLVGEAIEVGLSKDLAYEVLGLAGKLGLELLIHLRNKQKVGEFFIGEEDSNLVVPDKNKAKEAGLIQSLVEKFMPLVVDRLTKEILTPENVERLVKFLINLLLARSK